MSWLLKLNNFFLNSNLFISACVVALCQSSAILLNVEVSHLMPFVFFSTLFSYNFQRFVRFNTSKNGFKQLEWFKEQERSIKSITVIAFFLTIYFSFFLLWKSLVILIPAVAITVLYPLNFQFSSRNMQLREMPRLKIFWIVSVWTLVSVLLVASESGFSFSTEIWLLLASRFCFVLALTIPFDIRDLKYDKSSMKTIPQLFGVEKSKQLALISLAFFELTAIVHYIVADFSFYFLLALLFTSLYVGILVYKTNEERKETFYTFWLEGSSLLMCFLLFISHWLLVS